MPRSGWLDMDKRWLIVASIGLIVFLITQVFPMSGDLFATENRATLSRDEARTKTLEIAASKFGLQANQIEDISLTHISNGPASGYFSKEGLMEEFDKKWEKRYPIEVYRADIQVAETGKKLVLLLHMGTGELVRWKDTGTPPSADFGNEEPAATAKHAAAYAEFWGVPATDWEWTGKIDSDGGVPFQSRKAALSEATLKMTVHMPSDYRLTDSSLPPWSGGSVLYKIDVPESFASYMKQQENIANRLSLFAFILPELAMFVLAIVYAGICGSQTSFVRGIFLSAVFFVIYVVITLNMMPALRASDLADGGTSSGNVIPLVVTTIVIYLAMAGMTYFSAVGGDGLWKSMGISLWPRWREAGYGADVLRSMLQGYPLAVLLLGAQSLILLILEKTLNVFASSDPSQSTYNMTLPWILPLLAWCAGISEEIQSRFFGIALFRKWFVGLARAITRREPSSRTVALLTTAAILPPGLVWALGHVGYTIYPFYTRVIELVLLSLLFGWFMLRFGLMTVIFAHVTLDSILMGVQMIFDGLPGDLWAGMFSIVMPALVGIAIWALHRTFRRRNGSPLSTV
ncbi:type II CAAX prenyl endopeptidase Rce1 family protein [Cohnella faecalis]|uniref:CPBP family intramembrane metalloprotease n=1 Tax=Cohnella faecalis TaxID=2315694 RepID=A0A398CKV0_9BACL|nr:CPBP family intramembrane glutamic endopeptidase [Cohnella faecalis]RIE02792.1 CPBP family intramembrane metalloprotease [Cohnella faecalis]